MSSDDLILALPVFPSGKCEDKVQELRTLLCEQCTWIWGCGPMTPHRKLHHRHYLHMLISAVAVGVVQRGISTHLLNFWFRVIFFLALFFSVLAYQKPNAKKLRRTAQRAEQLAAKGVVPRRQKLLLNRRPVQRTTKKAVAEANNNPNRDFYDIWDQERKSFMVVSAISPHDGAPRWQKCNSDVDTTALKWCAFPSVVYTETRKWHMTSFYVLHLSSDDPILALPAFPLWECEDQLGAQMIVMWTVVWDLRIN